MPGRLTSDMAPNRYYSSKDHLARKKDKSIMDALLEDDSQRAYVPPTHSTYPRPVSRAHASGGHDECGTPIRLAEH